MLSVTRRRWPGAYVVLIAQHANTSTSTLGSEHGYNEIIDKNYQIDHIIERLKSVIERVKLEKLALDESERIRTIAKTASRSWVWLGPETRTIIDANPSALTLFGYALPELKGRSFNSLLAEPIRIDPGKVASKGVVKLGTLTCKRKDGRRFAAQALATTSFLEARPQTTIVLSEIVSNKHRRHLTMIAAGLRASSLDQNMLDNLVQNVSDAMGVDSAIIGIYDSADATKLKIVASNGKMEFIKGNLLDLAQTPCGKVLGRSMICVARDLRKRYPNVPHFTQGEMDAYMGVSLVDGKGERLESCSC